MSSALVMLCAALFAAPLASTSPEAMIGRVQAAMGGKADLEGDFTQTYRDSLKPKLRVEKGHVWVKADGRVRWSYQTPTHKDFIFDGKAAYFYEPDNAQVTVFDEFNQSPLASAMNFVWGRGKLDAWFTYHLCDDQCLKVQQEQTAVLLQPKKPMAAVQSVTLVMDKKSARVQRSLVVDTLGNRTEYAFDNLHETDRVPDTKFIFKIPEGISVLRASSQP